MVTTMSHGISTWFCPHRSQGVRSGRKLSIFLAEAQKYSFSSFRSFALSDFGQRALGTFLWMAGQAWTGIT